MKLIVLFVCANEKLSRKIGKSREKLVPTSLRRACADNLRVHIGSMQYSCDISRRIGGIIEKSSPNTLGFIVVVDDSIGADSICVRDCVFCVRAALPCPEEKSVFGNRMSSVVAGAVKGWQRVKRLMDDGRSRKILMLPLNYFKAEEIDMLRSVFDGRTELREFSIKLDEVLKSFRRRFVPKRRVRRGRRIYLKDDAETYFELALEKHGLPDSSIPPHDALCDVASRMRFGVPIEAGVHFNLSYEGQRIGGEFIDCHGEHVSISPRSHLNVFPNGFVR